MVENDDMYHIGIYVPYILIVLQPIATACRVRLLVEGPATARLGAPPQCQLGVRRWVVGDIILVSHWYMKLILSYIWLI